MGFGGMQVASSDRYRQVVLADNPLTYARLAEPSGTTVQDASGNARTGTYTSGGTTDWIYSQTGALKNNPNSSVSKEATATASWTQTIFRFDYNQAWTAECWLKYNGTFTGNTILGNQVSAGGIYRGWMVYIVSNTRIDLYMRNNYNAGTEVSAQVNMAISTIGDNAWHHIVATYSGNGLVSGFALYVDNVAATPTTVFDTLASNTTVTTAAVLMGGHGDGILYLPVDTFLDEMAVYNTALSAARIGVHYNAGKNGA